MSSSIMHWLGDTTITCCLDYGAPNRQIFCQPFGPEFELFIFESPESGRLGVISSHYTIYYIWSFFSLPCAFFRHALANLTIFHVLEGVDITFHNMFPPFRFHNLKTGTCKPFIKLRWDGSCVFVFLHDGCFNSRTVHCKQTLSWQPIGQRGLPLCLYSFQSWAELSASLFHRDEEQHSFLCIVLCSALFFYSGERQRLYNNSHTVLWWPPWYCIKTQLSSPSGKSWR